MATVSGAQVIPKELVADVPPSLAGDLLESAKTRIN
jgi:hypothetical protein